MALKPEDVISKEADLIEKYIDNKLSKQNYIITSDLSEIFISFKGIHINLRSSLENPNIIKAVTDRYIKSGWGLIIFDNRKDIDDFGVFLSFVEKPKK